MTRQLKHSTSRFATIARVGYVPAVSISIEEEMSMITKRQRRILRVWDALDDGDISTEMLFAMVENETGADAGDISEALLARKED